MSATLSMTTAPTTTITNTFLKLQAAEEAKALVPATPATTDATSPQTGITLQTPYADNLRTSSYIRFRPSFTTTQNSSEPASEEQVQQFVDSLQYQFDRLPLDPFALDQGNRFRRYSRVIVLPWESPMKVHWTPGYIDPKTGEEISYYNQGGFNPEHANLRRGFSAIPAEYRTDMLEQLILSDVARCDWDIHESRHPIIVGVHMIKTAPTREHPVSKTTPNALHQDGHKFSLVHLVKRNNAKGGLNAITAHGGKYAGLQPDEVPEEDMMTRFYLEKPLDSWGAYDSHVAHYAGPVMQADPEAGSSERSVIICDIEPMVAAVCPL